MLPDNLVFSWSQLFKVYYIFSYVEFTFSVASEQEFCNDAQLVVGDIMTSPVLLQYRTKESWTTLRYFNESR